MQNISPIKQRILQYIDHQGISKRNFYDITSISRGTLNNPSGITEETLAKFIAVYPNISPYWLLFGTGAMEIDQNYILSEIAEPGPQYRTCQQCQLREVIIQEKSEIIKLLKEKIDRLNRDNKPESNGIRQTG